MVLIADGPENHLPSAVELQHQKQPEEDHPDTRRSSGFPVPQEATQSAQMPDDRTEAQGHQTHPAQRAIQTVTQTQEGLQGLWR